MSIGVNEMAKNQRVGILDKSRKFSVGTSINNPNNGICYVCNEESKLYKVPNMVKRMCFDCKADFREYAKQTGITGTIESESY